MPSIGPELLDGLIIMAVGMAVVFMVLILLMGTIITLGRLFPDKGTSPPKEPTPGSKEVESGILAAVSVALASIMGVGAGGQVALASQTSQANLWRLFGRRQLMESGQGVKDKRSTPGIRPNLRRWWPRGGRR